MFDLATISDHLELRADGLWHPPYEETIHLPPDGNEFWFAVEDKSFWYNHRNDCITTLAKKFPPPANGAIFDIGGGNGYVSLGLASAGFNTVVVEPRIERALNAKSRGLKNVVCATAHSARFKPASLPAVGLFDVIEHMEDDLSFLQHIQSRLSNGGRLYVAAPAYHWLWSRQDDSVGHIRRYHLASLGTLLEQAGFKIVFATYIFRWLPLPIAILRAIPYRMGLFFPQNKVQAAERAHGARGGLIPSLAAFLCKKELKHLHSGRPISFGASCLIVADKHTSQTA